MNLVLGFVPFILFDVLMHLSVDLGLWAALAAAFTLGMRSFLDTRVLKTLDAGNTVLFGVLALYKGFVQPSLPYSAVLIAVDGGLLAIAIGSLLLHEPFTLQYAREVVEPEIVAQPAFMTTNYILTWAWIGAFILMLVADILLIYWPSLPVWIGVAVAFAARNCAVYFTTWYSARRRAQFARQA